MIFCQKLVKEEKEVNYSFISKNIHFFELCTLKAWGGDDQDVFWARVDDDLIIKMIKNSRSIVKSNGELVV